MIWTKVIEWPWPLVLIKLHVFILLAPSINFYIISTAIISEKWKFHCFNFFPYKSIGNQIWPCRKIGHGQPRGIISTDVLVLEYSLLQSKFHDYWPFCSREDFFKGFYYIWAWRPSWSCDVKQLYTHFHSPSHGGSTCNFALISLAVPKEKLIEMLKMGDLGPRSMNDLDLRYW